MLQTGRWVAVISLAFAVTVIANDKSDKGEKKPEGNAKGTAGGATAPHKSALKTHQCADCKKDLAKDGDLWECEGCKAHFDADGKKIKCKDCVEAAEKHGKCEKCDPAKYWGAGRAYACEDCAKAAQDSEDNKKETTCTHCKVNYKNGKQEKSGGEKK